MTISLLGFVATILALAGEQPDHAPLLAMRDQATMVASAREQWAVATIVGVGEERMVPNANGGRWRVFDVDLRVRSGWNLPTGLLRTFWNQDDALKRLNLVRGMVGARVLVRLAPVAEGRSLIVSGTDAEPELAPTFARGDKPLLRLLLPYSEPTFPQGSPVERRFRALWRVGASLTPSAYPLFERYMGATELPKTSLSPFEKVYDGSGNYVDRVRPAGADVQWLRRFAQTVSPDYQMLVEENLRRNGVAGTAKIAREMIRRALRTPDLFPNGLFRVFDPIDVATKTWEDPAWPPAGDIVARLERRPNVALTGDLLRVLGAPGLLPPERGKILHLLNDPDPGVRRRAAQLFERWHGKPPKDADSLAWHRARASLSAAELTKAKAASGN